MSKLVVSTAFLVVLCGACSSAASPSAAPATSPSREAVQSSSTSSSPVTASIAVTGPECTQDQVAVTFRGTNAATQSVVGAFQVQNTTDQPCTWHHQVRIDLLAADGSIAQSVQPEDTSGSVELQPTSSMSFDGFYLTWYSNDIANGGTVCSDSFTPSKVRVALDDSFVQELDATAADGSSISACHSEFGLVIIHDPA